MFCVVLYWDFICCGGCCRCVKRQIRMAKAAAEAKARESDWVPVDDTRAQMGGGAGKAVNVVVGLVVGSLMAAYLLPLAINEIMAVETTAWSDGAAALWEILPVMIVLAIFLFFVGLALRRSEEV